MDMLKDFEKDLNKCSKCGLCESACPLFKINPNDCVASKGKFIMLHGVTKGDLKLSKNINKYLDMCLKCGKCNAYCPSGIDVCRILNTAKYEYMKTTLLGRFIKFLESRLVFGFFMNVAKFISAPFRPKKKKVENPVARVMYFKGCLNQICPRTDKYIEKIFKDSPLEIIEPDFECCGLPFLSEGNLERFIEVAQSNVEKINGDYDYFVTDCASCESTIFDYPRYLNNIHLPLEKSVNWGYLIALKKIRFQFKKPIKVTFHKPCHLQVDSYIERIFDNCENIEYVKMEDYDACCGFAGSFGIKNRKYSKELSKQKAININKTQADYVVTTCPACILGLKQGLALTGEKTKVVSLLEFLAKADNISL